MAEFQHNYADGFESDGYLNHEAGELVESGTFRDADKHENPPQINGATLLKGPSLDSDPSPIDLGSANSIAVDQPKGGFREVHVGYGKTRETVYVVSR